MNTSPGAGRRRIRSDAVANERLLLDAAESYIAAQGPSAPLAGLADAAGVGIGTLYRHFEDRSALMKAVFARVTVLMEDRVGMALSSGTGWERLVAGFDAMLGILLEHPAFYQVRDWLLVHEPTFTLDPSWNDLFVQAVADAKAEGELREDVAETDLAFVPYLLAPIARYPEPLRQVIGSRQLALVLSGGRAYGGLVPLPGPVIRAAEVAQITQHIRAADDG